jgi:putative glutamine amidotransferase
MLAFLQAWFHRSEAHGTRGFDIPAVREIFERINQEGRRLNSMDLMIARTFRNYDYMVEDHLQAASAGLRRSFLDRKPRKGGKNGWPFSSPDGVDMRPLIGITCSRQIGGAWGAYDTGHPMDYAFDDYSRAVLRCGGAPVLIPTAQDNRSLSAVLDRMDGILLTGGPDVHPRFYGEAPLPRLGDLDEELDRAELAVTRAVLERDMPLFAVCRGIQVLNVALGGTLIQDIATQVEDAINHVQLAPKQVTTHEVRLEPGSMLAGILNRRTLQVNGKHHQAVKGVAPGLDVVARASDGVIEALECPERTFVLAVQWHPEGTWRVDAPSRKLFQALVRASGEEREG